MIHRRSLLLGLASALAAPAIVHAGNIMPVRPWKPFSPRDIPGFICWSQFDDNGKRIAWSPRNAIAHFDDHVTLHNIMRPPRSDLPRDALCFDRPLRPYEVHQVQQYLNHLETRGAYGPILFFSSRP